MGVYDKEINIIEKMSMYKNSYFVISNETNHDFLNNIISSIIDFNLFNKKWNDNSSSQYPPDFINDNDKIMMEVMRVDDHSKNGKKNPTLEREYFMEKELLAKFPQFMNTKIHCIANSGLPTNIDHNYNNYLKSFDRTITKHKNKIKNYKNNYPNYKLIFLIFDETSGAYFEKGNDNKFDIQHTQLFDLNIINKFKESGADYLLWFNPYFHIYGYDIDIPAIRIFDINSIQNDDYPFIKLNVDNVVSNEL